VGERQSVRISPADPPYTRKSEPIGLMFSLPVGKKKNKKKQKKINVPLFI
jgi:hypothetical protein